MGRRSWAFLLGVSCIIFLTLLLSGCGASADGQGDRGTGHSPDIRGYISSVSAADSGAGGVLGSVLIEGELEEDTQFDKASVTVTEDTRIFRESSGGREEVPFEDLKAGQYVQASFTGPVAESYPVQATASEMVILPGPPE